LINAPPSHIHHQYTIAFKKFTFILAGPQKAKRHFWDSQLPLASARGLKIRMNPGFSPISFYMDDTQ
jgi:hypothetical protein